MSTNNIKDAFSGKNGDNILIINKMLKKINGAIDNAPRDIEKDIKNIINKTLKGGGKQFQEKKKTVFNQIDKKYLASSKIKYLFEAKQELVALKQELESSG